MKKFLSSIFVFAALSAAFAFSPVAASATYPDYGGYSGAFHGTSADAWVLESGGVLTIKSGGSLVVNSGAIVSISSSVTSNDLSLTYGIHAATAVITGAASVGSLANAGAITNTGAAYFGAANTVSTITAAGAATFSASVSVPVLSVTNYLDMGAGLTKSAILALPGGAVGRMWKCSDCTAVHFCVSTGTAVGAQTKETDKTAKCD